MVHYREFHGKLRLRRGCKTCLEQADLNEAGTEQQPGLSLDLGSAKICISFGERRRSEDSL